MVSSKIRMESTSPSHGGMMFLPRSWLNQLELTPGRYRLAFGVKEANVLLMELEKRQGDDLARISPDVIRTLFLPRGAYLSIERKDNLLRLGFVYGILANVKADGEQVTGQQEPVFRHLLEAANDLDLYGYVFSPLDIDWENQTTIGYRWVENRRWRKEQLPLPDVVYDQIASRQFEKRDDVALAREQLYKLLAPRYFNPGYFDKWQVHQWLSENSTTRAYVPETICFQSAKQATEFLYRYPDVYMKPVHGSLGIGIIRLQRKQDGRVFYQLKRKDSTLRQEHVGSISMFLKQFHKRLQNGPYLIQESLQLMTWQGRPFDIRMVLQKDGTGTWNRTKSFCRIAQEGQITSNLSTGGDAFSVRQVLTDILNDEKKVQRVRSQLHKMAREIPKAIEQKTDSSIGELGLDLGLDEAGRIWVIEVNAKPWKKPNIAESERKDLALLAFQRPVQYARYLCKTYRDA